MVKQVQIVAHGEPERVAHCVEAPDPGAPEAGEVRFDVLAFPINPADIAFCRGQYRLRPELPSVPGAECVGRVTAVGADVADVAPGDLVINLQRENWAQHRRVAAEDVIVLPPGIDLRQAAMIRINPPTALLMLTEMVDLQPGDWVVQNAANSAVGRLLILHASALGLSTLNVVRRPSLFAELAALGADAYVADGPDLAARARAATGGASIRLGIDAVAGSATARIAACLDDGGTVVTYGAMSREDPTMAATDLIQRGVSLAGFMLGRCLAGRGLDEIRALYDELAASVVAGTLGVPVEHVYPIEDIAAALTHAQRSGRDGKILVAPNGEV